MEIKVAHVVQLAAIIRRVAPRIVFAPTIVENQHPDHTKLGRMVRDAARLARYGGVRELAGTPPHAIEQLLFYAVTPGAEPPESAGKILVDVSEPRILAVWQAAMEAHATQRQTREYGELQLTRARLNGLLCGVGHAVALWPSDPIVFDSLESLRRSARRF
jgi:LmbE family N-acetylglucosaminyl deacetylase